MIDWLPILLPCFVSVFLTAALGAYVRHKEQKQLTLETKLHESEKEQSGFRERLAIIETKVTDVALLKEKVAEISEKMVRKDDLTPFYNLIESLRTRRR